MALATTFVLLLIQRVGVLVLLAFAAQMMFFPTVRLDAAIETLSRFENIFVGDQAPTECLAFKSVYIRTPENILSICNTTTDSATEEHWTRISGAIVVEGDNDDALPLPCVKNATAILLPLAIQYICITENIGEPEDLRCNSPVSGFTSCWQRMSVLTDGTTGIQTTATDVKSIRFGALNIAEADDCILGPNTLVNVTAGANGKACFLPDPALVTTPGWYRLYVDDANYVTLAPTSGALINGADAPLPAIKGPDAYYDIWRTKTDHWKVTSVSPTGYGEPITTVCRKFGGDTNTSTTGSGAFKNHSLTCTFPINTLRAGTELEACSGWQVTTGSTAPTQLEWRYSLGASYATSVPLNTSTSGVTLGDNLTARNGAHCVTIMVGANPSAATPLYTMPVMAWSSFSSAVTRGSISQPVTLATNVALTLYAETLWNTAGAGAASTIVQQFLTVKVSGLGD